MVLSMVEVVTAQLHKLWYVSHKLCQQEFPTLESKLDSRIVLYAQCYFGIKPSATNTVTL